MNKDVTMRIIVEVDGVERFKENKAVRLLLDEATNKGFGLNEIWTMYYSNRITIDDLKELYQLIGYSVCGYEDVFTMREESNE